MNIDLVSDLHGFYPKLDGGDLLIVAGDLTKRDLEHEYATFDYWLNDQNYKKKIVIAGNHDNFLQEWGTNYLGSEKTYFHFCDYLCDSGTEFEGFKIWGSPWTKTFIDMHPKCKAFTLTTETELEEKFNLIPNDIDILITHSPPYGILDRVFRYENEEHCGSKSLLKALKRVRPKLHVFGHIHEEHGMERAHLDLLDAPGYPIFVNASYVDEYYEPINKPIRVIL